MNLITTPSSQAEFSPLFLPYVFSFYLSYICILNNAIISNWSEKQEAEKDKTRREKLAGYFFDLSKLSFAGLVIGGIVSIKPDSADYLIEIYRAIIGCIFTISLARTANTILK